MPDETPGLRFDRAYEAYRPEMAMMDPTEIHIDPHWNPRRMDDAGVAAHVVALKASILEIGVLNPIEVRYDPHTRTTTLVTGQCRLTACRELKREGHDIKIPVLRVKGDEADLAVRNLVSNSGRPLRQDELGVVFVLRDYGIVVVGTGERLPPGAVSVVTFWKSGRMAQKESQHNKK